MTQFKEKSANGEARVGLFTYPVLMAADILLYETATVPVGDDQRQHMALAREIARRFNGLYGDIFVVPEMVKTTLGARVMDLQNPLNKMSKSVKSPGTVLMLDSATVIKRKVMRAATDSESGVAYDKDSRPGLANLLEIYGALSGESVHKVAARYSNYRDLKGDLGDLICGALAPIGERYGDIRTNISGLEEIMVAGAAKAASVSGPVYERATAAMGLPKSI
jgi:tryptophanyl-tRNA synthetase